jgi:hypothetical protein
VQRLCAAQPRGLKGKIFEISRLALSAISVILSRSECLYPTEKLSVYCINQNQITLKLRLHFSILIVFLAVYGFSQDKGYIAVSIGPSFPNGDFGSKDVDNSAAGFATTGAIFDLTFAQKLGKTLGITLLLRGQSNPVDPQPLVDQLYSVYPSPSWSGESTNWGIGGLMGGLYGSFPMGANGKVTFDTRAMIGYINATSPEITVSAYSSSNSIWVQTQSADAGSFAYLLGVGLKYSIGNHLGLLVNLDYMASNPEFVDVSTITSLGGYTDETYSQQLGTVNLGVGIGWRW